MASGVNGALGSVVNTNAESGYWRRSARTSSPRRRWAEGLPFLARRTCSVGEQVIERLLDSIGGCLLVRRRMLHDSDRVADRRVQAQQRCAPFLSLDQKHTARRVAIDNGLVVKRLLDFVTVAKPTRT